MKAIFQLFKKYPIAIICYLLYSILTIRVLQVNLQFHEILKHLKPEQSGLSAGGEAVSWMDVFYVIIAGIFVFIIFANAIARKEGTKFYLWLSFIIIVQFIAALNIS